MSKIRIAITQGDTNGIGYEVIFKALAHEEILEYCTPIIYGNDKIAQHHLKMLEEAPKYRVIEAASQAEGHHIFVINSSQEECAVEYGKSTPAAGRQAQAALRRAMTDYKAGLVDVLVTAPICKASIHSDSFPYPGHTEFLENATQTEGLMILSNPQMRVALATTHLPISQVSSAITPELLENKLQMLFTSLKRDFMLSSPRIAVLALNPHCGDAGTIGQEDAEIIAPTIEKLRAAGVPCFGPYSADGFFGDAQYQHFDAVLAMYHDQGLAPLKALGMEEGVNFTAGLPIVRTSPDHGTAFDIAGQNKASADSMRQAIYQAIDVFRNRRAYDEAHKNPLPSTPRRTEREHLPIRG